MSIVGAAVASRGPCTITLLRSTALSTAIALLMSKSARFWKIHTGAWSYTLKASSAESGLSLNSGSFGVAFHASDPPTSEIFSGPIVMGEVNVPTRSNPSRPSNNAR